MFQNKRRAPEVLHFTAQEKGQCQFAALIPLMPVAAIRRPDD